MPTDQQRAKLRNYRIVVFVLTFLSYFAFSLARQPWFVCLIFLFSFFLRCRFFSNDVFSKPAHSDSIRLQAYREVYFASG
ncbi:MAG TPA: hypothetical protein V6C97_30225 [Oculatellaceae cyanobacterium]